ncbi:MAG TPA: MFS transporter [Micromonosporaceae bacterium]
MATPFSILTGNRDFRRLFLAELVVFGGDWFVMVPLLVLLTRLTGNGFLGGVTLAADNLIQALLLPYAGVIADRHDRRRVMITANVAAFISVLLLLLVRSEGTAWLGPFAVGCVAVAKAFYSPSASAALPNLVEPEDLSAANAVSGSAWGTMTVIGSSLGGVLSAAFGPYTCFLITAALLAVAAVLALGVRRPMQASRDGSVASPHVWASMREAGGYIARRPRVAALVTVKSAVGFGNGLLALFPVLAVSVFAVGSIGTGLLFAARGAGALVGPFLLRRMLRRRTALMTGLALSMATYGLAYIGVSLIDSFGLALVLVFLAHVAGGGNWVMSSYALQVEVPDALRGRVLSLDMTIATLAVSISLLGVSALESTVGTRELIAGCGAVTLLYAIAWRLVTLRLGPPTAEITAPAEVPAPVL